MATNDVINFVGQIAPLIVAEGQRRGYKVYSTVIAQAIIESRYGQSGLAKYHNYFGLKCGTAWVIAGKPKVVFNTKEEYKVGVLTAIKDAFRAYPDMASGVAGYYDFIGTRRYANLKTAVTYQQYAEMLKADGYATSSSYVKTLCDTVVRYNLAAYDVGLSPYSEYVVGKTYTTQQDLYVRTEPNGEKKAFLSLTENAQQHAFAGSNGEGILKNSTRVTVLDVQLVGSCTWVKIPSGWICAKNSKHIYVM